MDLADRWGDRGFFSSVWVKADLWDGRTDGRTQHFIEKTFPPSSFIRRKRVTRSIGNVFVAVAVTKIITDSKGVNIGEMSNRSHVDDVGWRWTSMIT